MPPANETVPASWLTELRRLLRERLGHEVGTPRLEGEIGAYALARARALALPDPAAWVALVGSPEGSAEWRGLLRIATVGETFFCRHPEQLRAIVSFARAAAERQRRPVLAWSAGCATGEEAWTLAILLAEEGIPARILGTDANPASLATARAAGRYSDRSAGHLPAALRERWLARSEGRWRVERQSELAVQFAEHNLAQDPVPRSQGAGGAWDLILCRNVLIYFREDVVRSVVARLVEGLTEEGGLWLGPADLVPTDIALAHRERHDGERLFRRTRAAQAPDGAPKPSTPAASALRPEQPARADERAIVAQLLRRGLASTAAEHLERRVAKSPGDGEAWVALAGCRLARHDFSGALAALARAGTTAPAAPGADYFRGVTRLRSGSPAEATDAFLAALEADPDDWAAAYQLALLARREGRPLQEEVFLERALPLLESETPVAPDHGPAAGLVDGVHSDPMTVRRAVERRLAELAAAGRPSAVPGGTPA